MPIKKDETGKRWVEMQFITPGTPEQVWEAMATGPGNSAWFTRATIEGRVGGVLRFHFGPEMSTSGEVTMWEPPHRFGYVERDWNPGAPPIATEITITSRAGDQCVVRMVHSLFSSTDDWDDQMESFEGGWPGFFEVLRVYLTHFAAMKGMSFQAMASTDGEPLELWLAVTEGLNLAGANVGERRSTASVPQQLTGTIERTQQDQNVRWIVLKLDSPSPGVAIIGTHATGGRVHASVSIFFYGDHADAMVKESEGKWGEWVRSLTAK